MHDFNKLRLANQIFISGGAYNIIVGEYRTALRQIFRVIASAITSYVSLYIYSGVVGRYFPAILENESGSNAIVEVR